MIVTATTQNCCKYSGADWVARKYTLSPLGIKVANVFGQVGRGIYHYSSDLEGKNRPEWNNPSVITVVLSCELASFDGRELTMLLLCCNAADINVSFKGRRHGYIALTFTSGKRTFPVIGVEIDSSISVDGFIEWFGLAKPKVKLGGQVLQWHRERDRFWATYPDGEATQVVLSISNEKTIDLNYLAAAAHEACIRVSFMGLTHQSMELCLNKRLKRDGRFYERHPDWETHRESLRPYCSIDFESLK